MLNRSTYRTLAVSLQGLALSLLFLLGLLRSAHLDRIPFWAGWGTLFFLCVFGKRIDRWIKAWRYQSQVRHSLPGSGRELNALAAAAFAIREKTEERALFLLKNGSSAADPAVIHAQRWLTALAGVHWMARQHPRRLLSPYHNFPQLRAMIFCADSSSMPLRENALVRELAEITPAELDQLGSEYIGVMDELTQSLGRAHSPFGDEAEELLEFMTGRFHVVGAREQFQNWWRDLRPCIMRGSGALLVGVRLLARESFTHADRLLSRLAQGGLLSDETDTVRRIAGYLAFFTEETPANTLDIPRFFVRGLYYKAVERGVLRFPAAELPEIVSACKRGKVLRDAKRSLVESGLKLWETFGSSISTPLATMMERLLEDARPGPETLQYWRAQWRAIRDGYEKPVALLMDGVAQAVAGNRKAAFLAFDEAAKMERQWSTPLVNLVHLHFAAGRQTEGRRLIDEILTRFPKDGQAMISLGTLLVMHLEDVNEAGRLYEMAFYHTDPPTQALIYLGELQLMEGNYAHSQSYFDDARKIDPALAEPKLGLARVYIETKRYDKAIEYLVAVANETSGENRNRANYLLYRAYREKGDDPRAVHYLDKVPPQFFKEPDLLDDIAIHLENEKHYQKAREFTERAMILRAHGRGRSDDGDALNAF